MYENKENAAPLSSKKRKSPSQEEEKSSLQKKAFRGTREPLATLQFSLPLPENFAFSPLKTPPSSPSKSTTETPERRFWKPFKEELIKSGVLSDEGLESPLVRKIYNKTDTGDFFSSPIRFKDKTVFQADDLFNPDAFVLSNTGKWETNLERMERGLCPVGHKGIFKGDRSFLSSSKQSKIQKKQRTYRIELQHMTQKDTGLDDDPICEMTRDAHMGEDTWHVLKKIEEGRFEIIASSIKKENALAYLEQDTTYIMVANVLHFRSGSSLIDRIKWDLWRKAYWKALAKGGELRTAKLPLKRSLFMEFCLESRGEESTETGQEA